MSWILILLCSSEVAKPSAYTATKYSNQSIILSSLLSVKDGRVENWWLIMATVKLREPTKVRDVATTSVLW